MTTLADELERLGKKASKGPWENDSQQSLDAAIGLVERMLPDTDDKRYHGVVWFGRNPAARIFYDSRDTEAEGGWSIGALNPHEVHASTPALALLIALLEALNAKEQAKP